MSQIIISPIEEALNIILADKNKINEINNLIKTKKNIPVNISKNLTEIEFDLKIISNLINKFNSIYKKKKKDITAFESQKKEYTIIFNSLNKEIDKLKNEIQSSKNENNKLKLIIKIYEENETKKNFNPPPKCHYNYNTNLLHNDSPYAEIYANNNNNCDLFNSPKLHFDYNNFLNKNDINNQNNFNNRNYNNNELKYSYSVNGIEQKNFDDNNIGINIEDRNNNNNDRNEEINIGNREMYEKVDKIQKIVNEVFSDGTVLNEVKKYLGNDVEEKLLNADVTEEYLEKIELVLELINSRKDKNIDISSKVNNNENFLVNKIRTERPNNNKKTKRYYEQKGYNSD